MSLKEGEWERGKQLEQGNREREIKREREGDRHWPRKRQVKPKKTHQIFNVVFQQSQANFQRTIPPMPLTCKQNVPQILPNGTQKGPKVSLLGALGELLSPSRPQVTKACKIECLKTAKGSQRRPQNQEMCNKNGTKYGLESGPAKVDEQVLTRYL